VLTHKAEHKEIIMLFHVKGTQTYFLGSLHYLPTAAPHLPRAIWQIADRSRRLVFESNVDDAEKPRELPITRTRECKPLEQRLPAPLFTATSVLWNHLIGGAASPNDLKIWAVLQSLVVAMLKLCPDLSRSLGVDRQLWNKAATRGLVPHVLEGFEMLEAFDDAPLAEQVINLERLVSDPLQAIRMFGRMHTAWRSGNLAELEQIHYEMLSAQPHTGRGLTFRRNKLWLRAILEHIRSDEPTLITVGILHFVGDESIPALLHEVAFEAVPVAVDDAPRGLLSTVQ
jgi:uncharacterized protein